LQNAAGFVLPPTAAPSSTSGCDPANFNGFVPGNIALIQRGGCSFNQKATNAKNAGAAGAIIFNEGNPGRTDDFGGTLGAPVGIPVLSASHAVGVALSTGATVHLKTQTLTETRNTFNLMAETSGSKKHVVVVGAHLDSVLDGAGIEDNGSGSAANLEIAIQMKKLHIEPENRVRFMWWSAEEEGLLGSEDYVASLSDADKQKIMLNLNFDMIASPNYIRFVYDGDGSDTPDAGPPGSEEIERVFATYFQQQGLPFEPTAFDGRSDYGPFIEAGIPAGGLFSGAEELKTVAEAAIYGGTAGQQLDPCYHLACDTYANNNEVVFEQLADAAADAIMHFAMTEKPLTPPPVAAIAARSTSLASRTTMLRKGHWFQQ
jgi:Zn-dependent M28 family amino/carboxypeptidase